MHEAFDVIVIGAGVAGLAARRALSRAGQSVLTIEKSRGLGGRCSSKRGEGWIADLGAQFTAVSEPEWQEVLTPLKDELRPVSLTANAQYPRFVPSRGMSSLAHALKNDPHASGEILLSTRVLDAQVKEGHWHIKCEDGQTHHSRKLVISSPMPQALAILSLFSTPAVYTSCLVVGFQMADVTPSFPSIFQNPSPSLLGIFDQKKKGLTSVHSVLVVHAAHDFSQTLWGQDDVSIHTMVSDEVKRIEPRLTLGAPLFLHRWKYCEVLPPEQLSPSHRENWEARFSAPLALACDGFLGRSSVEAAFMSGHRAAKRLL